MYVVYVLYSPDHNKHYTGCSANFAARFLSHNELGTKGWTIKYRPWKIIYTKEFTNQSEALAHEKWLKSGVGRNFIKTLLH